MKTAFNYVQCAELDTAAERPLCVRTPCTNLQRQNSIHSFTHYSFVFSFSFLWGGVGGGVGWGAYFNPHFKCERLAPLGNSKGQMGRRRQVDAGHERRAALCCHLARLHAEKLTLNHALCLLVCPYMHACSCVCVCAY